MHLTCIDATRLDRPANQAWFVRERASQRYRFQRCLALIWGIRKDYRAALDIGCARGDFSRELAVFCGGVTALDVSPGIVEAARSATSEDNVRFHCCPFLASRLDSANFDLVCALEVLYYFEGAQADVFLAEARRVIEDGGVFLLTMNVYGDTSASARRIVDQVSPHFEVRQSELIYRELYYRMELPLIRLIEDIAYLRLWLPFRLRRSMPAVATPFGRWLGRWCPKLLGPVEWCARRALNSGWLFAAVQWVNRCFGPAHGRNQLVLVATPR
jgi:2-polyprenyl-3-methyl-5-hydroxy-6-metoxy-1,4-benzoquinol methylase